MPPGSQRTRIPARVVERATAEADLALAQKVVHARQQEGDPAGSKAAEEVAALIQAELLGSGGSDPHP